MGVIRNQAGASGTVAGTNRIRRARVTSSAAAGVHALTPPKNKERDCCRQVCRQLRDFLGIAGDQIAF